MSYPCTVEQVVDCSLHITYSNGKQSDTLRSMSTARRLSPPVSKTRYSEKHPCLGISEHSSVKGTPKRIREWLMSSQQGSLVPPGRMPGRNVGDMMTAIYGKKQSKPAASYDRDTSSWRTSQVSLLTNTLDIFSETWSRAGMIVDGEFYRRQKWEHRIKEIVSGSLPTPNTMDYLPLRSAEAMQRQYETQRKGRTAPSNLREYVHPHMFPTPTQDATDRKTKYAQGGTPLSLFVKMYPTPAAHEARLGYQKRSPNPEKGRSHGTQQSLTTKVIDELGGRELVTGQLNPEFCEWLMGWMIGWTGLKPLEMECVAKWLRLHGIY